ncbi:hypothetical protein GFC01_11000 [Desulfofundulus thermobenzoicus]|uniref:Uncharacterized protein n=1 Tax=Desulfofundulus thermobenzoicus TaxID=29376 RepID=A0A6N7ITC8_9FIRM|nr:hypothetical protein [Desulfofundulus thermobenzoicus]MQL52779.1 hypothetical protein [Desulfofundulus thermobenzoicus]
MKIKIPIEEVEEGCLINGKKVVDVLHRLHAGYVRLTLEGGDILDGYAGRDMIVVEQYRKGSTQIA